jgi:hypothetical protein
MTNANTYYRLSGTVSITCEQEAAGVERSELLRRMKRRFKRER